MNISTAIGIEFHSVKIYTLGRFEINLDGQPVRFAFKTPRKPLDLLKSLLTVGNRGVSQHAVCDALWSDLDPVAAARALHTTMFRLRDLLHSKRSVFISDGRVCLNPEYCWVDAWAFERGLVDAKTPAAVESALQMYRGAFLADAEHPMAFEARDRLRCKFIRAVLQLGQHYERTGSTATAIEYYEWALAIDATSEEMHRALIGNLARLGQASAATAAYQRCRTILARRFGAAPSQATEHALRDHGGNVMSNVGRYSTIARALVT